MEMASKMHNARLSKEESQLILRYYPSSMKMGKIWERWTAGDDDEILGYAFCV
jgi:hypothetical protein